MSWFADPARWRGLRGALLGVSLLGCGRVTFEVDEPALCPDGTPVPGASGCAPAPPACVPSGDEDCGACARSCVAPGPHMLARCIGSNETLCQIACEPGRVDVDGLASDGCECSAAGDAPDDPPHCGAVETDEGSLFVTPAGDDTAPGTRLAPLRTIQVALQRAALTHARVLVAQGGYTGPFALVEGVSVRGGYRPDFAARDLTLYPSLLEAPSSGGAPVVVCRELTQPLRFEGFTVRASAGAETGAGSTAVLSDRCGSDVELAALTVLAARGADGARGQDSIERMTQAGVSDLAALAGVDGQAGNPAGQDNPCLTIQGGVGGEKVCFGSDVSGGDSGAATCQDLGCPIDGHCANAGCDLFEDASGTCDMAALLAHAIPGPAAQPGNGEQPGAAGALAYSAPDRGTCTGCYNDKILNRLGGDGGEGQPGADGSRGAACLGAGQWDASTGTLRAASGAAGGDGRPGSGGGGATAGSGYAVSAAQTGGCFSVSGGSGGGGGSGGCGALGAAGGQGGGASVGLVIVPLAGQGPRLVDVRVITSSGGRGGDGGTGVSGGPGGRGAPGGGTSFWCSQQGGHGGDGGPGGAAGGGGGGCGGGSHAVALLGGASEAYVTAVSLALQTELIGKPGPAGLGGDSPGQPGHPGMDGGSASVLQVP